MRRALTSTSHHDLQDTSAQQKSASAQLMRHSQGKAHTTMVSKPVSSSLSPPKMYDTKSHPPQQKAIHIYTANRIGSDPVAKVARSRQPPSCPQG